MPLRNHQFAAVAVTIAALGAGAAPAIAASATSTPEAASQTKLVQTIEKVTPRIRQNIQLGTTAQQRVGIPKLLANALACKRALASVDQAPATAAQQSGKREWLTGVHTQMIADQQISAGLLEEFSGQKTTGKRELSLGLTANNRADGDIARADNALGVS